MNLFKGYSPNEIKKAKTAYLCILPALLFLILVRAVPIVSVFFKSLTNWDGLYQNDFVGLKNYRQLFSSGMFINLFKNNMYLLLSVPLQVIIGLLVAVLLYEHIPGWKVYRAIFYVPQIISLVILGYLFKTMFGLEGPINQLLTNIGLGKIACDWLLNRETALPVMVFCITWYSIGWQTIVILGGMASIDTSVFEASRLDGASFWDRTFRIILPMIVSVISYCIVMAVIWTLTNMFALIYSMTGGGPGYETMTLDYFIYDKAFEGGNQLGYACAVSVILLLVVLVITAVELKISNRAEEKWG